MGIPLAEEPTADRTSEAKLKIDHIAQMRGLHLSCCGS